MHLSFDFAARSDIGLVRKSNQDSCYASSNILMVADGMGGHAGGDVASSIVVTYLSRLDTDDILVDDAANEIQQTLKDALTAISMRSARDSHLSGMGTTLSMLLRAGEKIVLAHIGDTRIYRYNKSGLERLTTDHTFVQGLIDEGEISESDAQNHPQRHFIMRALGDFDIVNTPDFQIFEAHPNERFLLCSDGLSGVVTDETIEKKLAQKISPTKVVTDLIQLSLKGSSMDNVTVVVGDTIDVSDKNQKIREAKPQVAGAVASDFEIPTKAKLTPAAKAALVIESATNKQSGLPVYVAEEDVVKKRISKLKIAVMGIIIGIIIVVGIFSVWAYSELNARYFIGVENSVVTVFKGIHTSVLGFKLYWPIESNGLQLSELPQAFQQRVNDGIVADTPEEVQRILDNLEAQINGSQSR
ncbi:MAG: protein phosphatase 2C domain-containing protein [Bifidobacteriaceae bacterium]|jgi:protein phosphatase|nr:protein phosphatase 2C domain-containing protein [Bifidobacteriaceae bacterium]